MERFSNALDQLVPTRWTVSGAEMLYVAMFDEIDEGTAIFKRTNDPPLGRCRFVTYEGLPSDQYLWLVGQVKRLLCNTIPVAEKLPPRNVRHNTTAEADKPRR